MIGSAPIGLFDNGRDHSPYPRDCTGLAPQAHRSKGTMHMKRHKHKRTDIPLTKLATGKKGKPFSRVIGAVVHNEREYTLHATKGYRSHKA